MPGFVKIAIAGRHFTLTREEARFLSEHLRTALVRPGACLSFRHEGEPQHGGALQVERDAAMLPPAAPLYLTDF